MLLVLPKSKNTDPDTFRNLRVDSTITPLTSPEINETINKLSLFERKPVLWEDEDVPSMSITIK